MTVKTLCVLGVLLIGCAATADAAIIPLGSVDAVSGQLILEGSAHGTGTIHGCVGRNNNNTIDVLGNQFNGNGACVGNPHSDFSGGTKTLEDLGFTGSWENLLVYLEIDGPTGVITLKDLQIAFFPSTGSIQNNVATEIWTGGDVQLNGPGTYAYALSAPSAATLAAFLDSGVRVGARFQVNNSADKNMTVRLFVGAAPLVDDPSPVPEPSTVLLSAAGLLVVGLIGRTRIRH